MSVSPSRILLLQLKRIGDAILTAPATAALRAAYPNALQTMVVSGPAAGIAPAFCEVNEVWNYVPRQLNAGLWRGLIASTFDVCLDFSGTDRSALMALCSGASRRVAYRKFAEAKPWRRKAFTQLSDASVRELHTVDFHFALVEEITGQTAYQGGDGGFSIPDWVDVNVPDLDHVGSRFVVVHPGTARSEKYWPAERWAGVIDYLDSNYKLSCVVTGSADPQEQAHLDKIKRECAAEFVDLAGNLSLLELALVIGRSTLALGVDSAAMHLAAAQNRRQIVLFGPTNPYHWRPRHRDATVLFAGDRSLNVRNLQPKLKSAPMTDLSTNLVCRAIDAHLAAAGPPS